MSNVQILLLTGIIFIALYFIIRLKKRMLDFVLIFVIAGTAITFVLVPELTNQIAKRIGVGRGADLVFYLSILLFWFVVLRLYVRIRKLEQIFTEIIRTNALEKAQRLGPVTKQTGDAGHN